LEVLVLGFRVESWRRLWLERVRVYDAADKTVSSNGCAGEAGRGEDGEEREERERRRRREIRRRNRRKRQRRKGETQTKKKTLL
jgi:hypothetical protein